MNLIKKIKIIFLSFLSLLIPVGICTWAISGVIKQEQLKAKYILNPLTEYVLNPTNGSVIYDDTLNNSGAFLGYDISNDFTYDNSSRTVALGNPKSDNGLLINQSIHFAHANSPDLNYSQDQFLNSNLFATDKNNVVSGANFNDVNLGYVNNRLFTIKLTSNLTISKNSSLSIGAKLGTDTSTGVSGAVISGENVCLDLNGHTLTIEEGSSLNAFGYVIDTKLDNNGKHQGKILNYGTIYAGFVVEDFHGGGNTVGRGFASQMPFSIYSIPYLSCKIEMRNNAKMICDTMLFANGVMNKTALSWFGKDDSFFIQSKGDDDTTVFDTYNNLNTGASYNQNMKVFYEFDGNFATNNLILRILFDIKIAEIKADIDMGQFSFIIPPYAQLKLVGASSNFDINMELLFLPGSSLKIEDDASITLTSNGYESIIRDVPVYGDRIIKEGTSYGGIISVPQMPPSSSTTYAYSEVSNDPDSISAYSYNYNYFSYYDVLEKENLAKNKSRIEIDGHIKFNTANNKVYNLAGLISLSDQALIDIQNNSNVVNTFYKNSYNFGNVPGASDLVSWVTSGGSSIPTKISYGGYLILPLVNANSSCENYNGLVVLGRSQISSGFSDYVTFDFRNGVFYDVEQNAYFAFILNDGNGAALSTIAKPLITGNIKKVSFTSSNNYINYGTIKYVYYQGCFVPTNKLEYLDTADGLYTQDSDGTYIKIENGKSEFTYDGKLSYKVFNVTESGNGYQAVRNYYEKRTDYVIFYGKWKFDYVTDFTNLPNIDGYVVSETGNDQFVTTRGVAEVQNIKGEFNEEVSETNEIVDLAFLSNSGAYSDDFLDTGMKCSLIADNSDALLEYGNWVQMDGTDSHLVLDENNITTISNVSRYKYQYLDWCYFERTATYISGKAQKDDVALYKRVLSSGSTLKFNNEVGLWLR